MTIEQRLLRDYGETDVPELATWMLADGTMINGTVEGRQRDVDHRCISEYFKRSKFENPGSAGIYLRKFMRRGNIRLCCSDCGYCVELRATPTLKQLWKLRKIMNAATRNGIETMVEWRTRNNSRKCASWPGYLDHLARYTTLLESA